MYDCVIFINSTWQVWHARKKSTLVMKELKKMKVNTRVGWVPKMWNSSFNMIQNFCTQLECTFVCKVSWSKNSSRYPLPSLNTNHTHFNIFQNSITFRLRATVPKPWQLGSQNFGLSSHYGKFLCKTTVQYKQTRWQKTGFEKWWNFPPFWRTLYMYA
jgi:hypothetical protein